jgi:hypothetical protein
MASLLTITKKDGRSIVTLEKMGEPAVEFEAVDPSQDDLDDLDDLDEAALRDRYFEVLGAKAGNRSTDTMRKEIRAAVLEA